MTQEEYYGPHYVPMLRAQETLLDLTKRFPAGDALDVKPIVYCCSRIKSPDSMIRKLRRRGFPTDCQSALTNVHDAVGLRIICAFAEDVYQIVAWLKKNGGFVILREKDYFAYPKPNGYRSYHLQIWLPEFDLPAEIQVRTIATDFWATLEHQLKYKKHIPHEELIRSELKRCADEIASTDLSMQTIRDIIRTSVEETGEKSLIL